MIDDRAVVKCYGCDHWFRLVATEAVNTLQYGDVSTQVRWCLSCIMTIEENTKDVIESVSDYPPGVPSWEQDTPELNEEG